MNDIVYLNGEFMPLESACIPVMDSGFIFGDGVYEVVPVYSRRPFRLNEHLQRLQHSLDMIRLRNPLTASQWTAIFNEIIARNEADDQSVYVQVTPGTTGSTLELPSAVSPTVFIMSSVLATPPRELVEKGVACICAGDYRWLKCDIKSVSLLANCLLKQMAVDAGAAEVILLRDGYVTEASTSNVFVVYEGMLLAPPKNNLILAGITYDVVLELAASYDIAHEVRPISERELRSAREIWLTSSAREVQAVATLDGLAVGDGRPGPLFRRMHALFQSFKERAMRSPE